MFKGALRLSSSCLCRPGAVKWIEYWFRDCVYTELELLGFLVGVSSVLFWMIAQIPQIFANILRQSVEALSPWFLFQWLAGDSLNLLGCLLTGDQLSTELFTAYYFIFADCLILSQFFYYQGRTKDRGYYSDESVHKPPFGYQTVVSTQSTPTLTEQAAGSSSTNAPSTSKSSERNAQIVGIMARGERFLDCEEDKLKHCNYHQIASPKPRKSNGNDCRRQLRRVVLEYGLEYGPACVSRLTMQHAVRLSQIQLKHTTARLSQKPTRLKKALCLAGLATVMVGLSGSGSGPQKGTGDFGVGSSSWTNRKLLMLCTSGGSRTLSVKHIGSIFGWVSAALYLGSRISQLIKNQQRKSTEGLSLGMVTCAVLANICYGLAILLRLESWADLMGKAPWIVGSMGTVSLDIAIFLQAQYLSFRYEKEPTERTPLLS